MLIKKNCLFCHKVFERQLSPDNLKRGKGKYCSQKCSASHYKEKVKNGEIKMNLKGLKKGRFKGKIFGKDFRKKISNSLKNKKGPLARNWKGGINPVNDTIRKSIDSKLWKSAVLARDNYTCQKTGIRGGNLVVHHSQNFSEYPELRFAIDNGITFSLKAHLKFHKKYGFRNNTCEQVEEFIESDFISKEIGGNICH